MNYTLNLDHCINSIQSSIQIKHLDHHALILENFFSSELNRDLLAFFNTNLDGWNTVPLQELLPRKSIEYSDDKIFNTTASIFKDEKLVRILSEKIGSKLISSGVSFWKDQESYQIDMHVDNNAFNCAFQIYITDYDSPLLGTSFGFSDTNNATFTIPYRNNSGYFLKTANITKHGLLHEVPKNFQRFSIYSRYSVVC